MTKKGYTLLSTLLTLMLIASLTVLTLRSFKDIDNDYLFFINEYLASQTNSIVKRESTYLDEYGIHFNENGHINGAKTIDVGKHSIIIHIGNGYLTYE